MADTSTLSMGVVDANRSASTARSGVPVIEFRGVWKSFGEREVMRGCTLAVTEGSTLVIMGESGSGKSVLIKLMNGLLLPDEGDVLLFGRSTREMSRRELMTARRRIGTLFQNYALFDSLTVFDNIAFPLREVSRLDEATIREKVEGLLSQLGLSDAAGLTPSELSGGMKKRVSLARALVTNPEVVLFDEPTTGLDPVMIEFVDRMLVDARNNYGITSVVISHDMASAFRLADRMAMLHDGAIRFEGTPDETRATDNPEVKAFVAQQTSRLEESDEQGEASAENAVLRWEDLPEPPHPPLVEVRELRKSFGDREVLKGVSFYILPNEITTIIGGSGSGKTVTMKHVLGLLQPTAGTVIAMGHEVSKLTRRELIQFRRRFGMLFQSAALFDSMSVRDNVAFPLIEQRGQDAPSKKEAYEQADHALEQLRIADIGTRNPSAISNGQRKRVGLARAIVTRPEIVIYDEPTTGLDPIMTAYVNDMIVEAQETFDVTAMIVSHDMASTFRVSDRIAMLYLGEIIAFGTPEDIRASTHPRVREFIFAGN